MDASKKLVSANNKVIPFVGLGTYPFQGKVMRDVVKNAIRIGYRLFDTSDDYRGEEGLGMAISDMSHDGIVTREDLFIQTKISDNNAYADEPLKGVFFNKNNKFMQRHTVEEVVREKVETSLNELGTSYLDSLLIHYPFPDYMVDIWKVMIELRKEGIVRYIGVSNFHEQHIEILIQQTGVIPDINEIYLSPIGVKQNLVNYCKDKGCQLMTYSPLMDVSSKRLNLELFQPLMKKYNKSLAQVVLRWNIDRGCMPLPKSKQIGRLKENMDIFNFSLTQEEVSLISSMNIDYQYIVESKICPGI